VKNLRKLHKLYGKCGPYLPTGYSVVYGQNPAVEPIHMCACGGTFVTKVCTTGDVSPDGWYHFVPMTRITYITAVHEALPVHLRKAFMAHIKVAVGSWKYMEAQARLEEHNAYT
jgi:hypothetical protein